MVVARLCGKTVWYVRCEENYCWFV